MVHYVSMFNCFIPSDDDRFKRLYREKCAIERMCVDKQQVTNWAKRELCIAVKLNVISSGLHHNILSLVDCDSREKADRSQ